MIRQGSSAKTCSTASTSSTSIVPPLRERREDIPPLIDDFLTRFTRTDGEPARAISPEALAAADRVPRGPATCASSRTSSSAWSSPAASPIVRVEDLPVGDSHAPGTLAAAARAPATRWPTTSIKRLIDERESFWTTVYPLYMQREITRANVRDIVQQGPRRGARQLQDRGRASSTWSRATTRVPEFPAEARLPAAVQGVSAVIGIAQARQSAPGMPMAAGIMRAAGRPSYSAASAASPTALMRRRLTSRRARCRCRAAVRITSIGPDDVLTIVFWRREGSVGRRRGAARWEDLAAAAQRRAGGGPDARTAAQELIEQARHVRRRARRRRSSSSRSTAARCSSPARSPSRDRTR